MSRTDTVGQTDRQTDELGVFALARFSAENWRPCGSEKIMCSLNLHLVQSLLSPLSIFHVHYGKHAIIISENDV